MSVFVPSMLTLAREAAGLTQIELARVTGITQATLSKYEGGLLHVADDHVEKMAAALNVPSAFFTLDEHKYNFGSSCTYHRKRQTMPVSELKQLLAQINMLRIRIARLLTNIDLESDNSIPRLDIADYEDPTEIARLVRRQWRLPEGPITNLVQTFEGAGGIIFTCSFGTRKLDAISQWIPGNPPFFFLNTDMPGERVRFSLAHELGHIVMHQNPTETREDEADQFATELLMPADQIRQSLQRLTLERAAVLKGYWRTSMAAIIYRAGTLECITPRQQRALFEEMSKQGWRINEPNPIPLETPSVIEMMLIAHVKDFEFTDQELLDLLVATPQNLAMLRAPHRMHLRLVQSAS